MAILLSPRPSRLPEGRDGPRDRAWPWRTSTVGLLGVGSELLRQSSKPGTSQTPGAAEGTRRSRIGQWQFRQIRRNCDEKGRASSFESVLGASCQLLSGDRLAFQDSLADQPRQGFRAECLDFLGGDRSTVMDPDRMRDRERATPRPGLESPDDGRWQDRHLCFCREQGDTRLEIAELPVRVRVPSGKRATIPPAFSRRRVSFSPWAPIPSRWIGNAPQDRMNGRAGRRRASIERHS